MLESSAEMPEIQADLVKTKARLAKLEGDFASSWAGQSRADYEKRVRQDCRDDVNRFALKLGVAIVAVIAGGNLAALKWAVQDAYRSENANLIQDFQRQNERAVDEAQVRGEWQQFHSAGVQCRYLLELYASLDLEPDIRRDLAVRAISRARGYFKEALGKLPQGQTYWELGDLYYVRPRKYGLTSMVDNELALEYYQYAAQQYTEVESAKGWRAQAYLQSAKVEIEMSRTESARKHLQQAREEYLTNASKSYDREFMLEEIRKLQGETGETEGKG